MNQPQTLNDVLRQLEEKEKHKKDILVNMRDLNYDSANGHLVIKGKVRESDGSTGETFEDSIATTSQAESQFFSRLGIPTTYARKTPVSLMAPHIEHWKQAQDQDAEVLIRTYKETDQDRVARAVLSGKYGILDNAEVVRSMIEPLGEHSQVRLFNTDAYGDMMNLRITDKRFVEYGKDPSGHSNPYFCGMHVVNGETGKYSVSASAMIWEQWCSNGAVRQRYGEALMKRKHVGSWLDLTGHFTEAAKRAPSLYQASINSFTEAQKEAVEHPYCVLYNLMKSNSALFTDKFMANIIDSFNRRKECTRYGIGSAITEACQKESSFERRLEAEKIAGNILFFNAPLNSYASQTKVMSEIDRLQELAEKNKQK